MRSRFLLALIASLGAASAAGNSWATPNTPAPAVSGGVRALPPANLGPTIVEEPAQHPPLVVDVAPPSVIVDDTGVTPVVAANPVAEGPKRAWLRQSREAQQAKEETSDSSGWSLSVLALVLLGGLAGGAVVMKLRRNAPAPWLPPSSVRVLSTTRLSPKASLITAEVHGRVILLGVTEQSINELGWIDDSSETPPRSNDEEDASDEPRPTATGARGGFGQVFGSVFGAGERKSKEPEFRGNPNVAALIAAKETRDVVSTSYTRASAGAERRHVVSRPVEPEPRVETQVAGLVRRRR